jgi:poly-gamma-glutamate capsule biosynthesis protein CapA/YwtB (metallophosphatase superfamily)
LIFFDNKEHEVEYPGKAFNFKMNPDNAQTLVEAKVNYVSLANNHTLDFGVQGMVK